jgi:hypothetical protein
MVKPFVSTKKKWPDLQKDLSQASNDFIDSCLNFKQQLEGLPICSRLISDSGFLNGLNYGILIREP